MKNRILIIILSINLSLVSCKNSNDGIWKSKVSDLELVFSNQWELIKTIDNNELVFAILTDKTDHSTLSVKITQDFPKEVSDELYFGAIKAQIINDESKNQIVVEDKIKFKEVEYQRLIYHMTAEFGEMTGTVYNHRNGKNIILIGFTYPKNLTKIPTKNIPLKIEELLKGMKT